MEPFVLACLALGAGIMSLALMRHPRAVMVLWLAVMIAVPVWLEARIGAVFPPLSLLFLVAIPAALRVVNWRITKADSLILCFITVSAVATFFADTPMFAFSTALVQWLPAYFVGRHLAPAAGRDWTYQAVAISAGVVGLWALVEFMFGWHAFQNFAGTTSAGGWQPIQIRGPFARSEGAFGHSIALGGFLSIGLPFILAAKFKPFSRLFLLVSAVAGLIVTFSRGPLVGGLIVVVLCVLFMASNSMSRKLRGWMLALLVVAGFTLLPSIFGLFDSLSYDTEVSTEYRTLLYRTILHDMHPLGIAEGVAQGPGGRYYYWNFGSIDNTYVLTVLQFGWLPLVFLLAGLVAVLGRVLFKRIGGPADIALVGQMFVMSTVALITQYGMAVWFCAGLAVAFGARNKPEQRKRPSVPDWATDSRTGLVTPPERTRAALS